jgi:hypothetical protein
VPMMAAYEQSDARDAARLLATRTLEGLRCRDPAGSLGNAIDNMYRLLQGYRSHGFFGYVEQARSEEEGSMTSLLTSSDRNVSDLKRALDDTFKSVFQDLDPGTAIDGMKRVMRIAAYPEAGESPDPAEVARAERFFSVLLDNLKA